MPFPTSPRVRFAVNPLTEVICQLRFPPVLEIQAAIPAEFQKRVRSTYPLFEQDYTLGFPKEIADVIDKLPGVGALTDSARFRFLSASKGQVLALTKDFIALTENRYEDWASFFPRMQNARTALESIYGPSFYTRIGLRYVNELDLRKLGVEEANWNEILNPSFVGILGATNLATQLGTLVTQAVVDISQHVPESKATLRFGLRRGDDGQSIFFIDSDCYREGSIEGPHVDQTLVLFNGVIGNIFRWAIGGHGRLWEALGPQPMAG